MIKVIITAIVCITGLEGYALYLGVDGAILALAVAAVAGLGGYEVKVFRDRAKGEEK